LPETSNTLEGNALQKAKYVYDNYAVNCFADDTGLEVEALHGRPGVFSARYAGPDCSPEDNIDKLLEELKGRKNRKARFRTVIACIIEDDVTFHEGIVEGEITLQRSGIKGFGYDPVFKPLGYDMTFAEMNLDQKNAISHRGRALRAFAKSLS
jgi:XTP/dITP diphosphohydrolase